MVNDPAGFPLNEDGDHLSVILKTDGPTFSLNARVPGYDCRPVLIDGPYVGQSYDPTYSLETHVKVRNNYVRRSHNGRHGAMFLSKTARFPVSSLSKLICYFILRGHKTIAFLPMVYNERSSAGEILYDMSSLVSDVEELRTLVSLGLVEFLREESTFAEVLRARAEEQNGVIVTTNMHMIASSCKNGESAENLISEKFKKMTTAVSVNKSMDIGKTVLPQSAPSFSRLVSNDHPSERKKFLIESVIVPVFYSFMDSRGFVICPLSLPSTNCPLTVEEILLSKRPSTSSRNTLPKHQLTFSRQHHLLKALAELVTHPYNGAPCFEQVFEAIQQLTSILGVKEETVDVVERVEMDLLLFDDDFAALLQTDATGQCNYVCAS